MSARLFCDGPGCDASIESDAPHLTVNVENEVLPSADEDGEFVGIMTMREIGHVDHHFCSPPCLAAWAMDRSIEDAS